MPFGLRTADSPPGKFPPQRDREPRQNRRGTLQPGTRRRTLPPESHNRPPAVNTSAENRRRKLAASISAGKPLLKNRCRKRSAAPSPQIHQPATCRKAIRRRTPVRPNAAGPLSAPRPCRWPPATRRDSCRRPWRKTPDRRRRPASASRLRAPRLRRLRPAP